MTFSEAINGKVVEKLLMVPKTIEVFMISDTKPTVTEFMENKGKRYRIAFAFGGDPREIISTSKPTIRANENGSSKVIAYSLAPLGPKMCWLVTLQRRKYVPLEVEFKDGVKATTFREVTETYVMESDVVPIVHEWTQSGLQAYRVVVNSDGQEEERISEYKPTITQAATLPREKRIKLDHIPPLKQGEHYMIEYPTTVDVMVTVKVQKSPGAFEDRIVTERRTERRSIRSSVRPIVREVIGGGQYRVISVFEGIRRETLIPAKDFLIFVRN
jgi:hypothetical protein